MYGRTIIGKQEPTVRTSYPYNFLEDFLDQCQENGDVRVLDVDLILNGPRTVLNENYRDNDLEIRAMNYDLAYTGRGGSVILTSGRRYAGFVCFSLRDYLHQDFSKPLPDPFNEIDTLGNLLNRAINCATLSLQLRQPDLEEARVYLTNDLHNRERRLLRTISRSEALRQAPVSPLQYHLSHNLI